MAAIKKGYHGLELLVHLNLDRFVVALALGAALFLSAYIGAPN